MRSEADVVQTCPSCLHPAPGKFRGGASPESAEGRGAWTCGLRTLARVFALLLVAFQGQSALAQGATPLGPFTLRLGSTVAWDSNLFRLPDSAPDPQLSRGIAGKSDRIATTSVGVSFDKAYWQQRFSLEISQTLSRYERFTFLDREALDYRGEWQWQLTSRISGALRTSSSQSLVSFEDARGTERIVRTTSSRGATVDGWLFGGWHLLVAASEDETSSSQTFLTVPDFKQTTGEFGFRYLSMSQSSIAVTRRLRRGAYAVQAGVPVSSTEGGYTVRESEAAATWLASGKSTLTARLTRLERRNEVLPERDFSGVAGEFGYAWTPTGKVSLSLSALRALSPFLLASSTHRVDDSIAFAPSWRVSDRTTMRMRASRTVSDFLGQAGPVAGPARRDVLRSVEFAADFVPHPKVAFGASLRREQRASTDAATAFDDTLVTVNASVRF